MWPITVKITAQQVAVSVCVSARLVTSEKQSAGNNDLNIVGMGSRLKVQSVKYEVQSILKFDAFPSESWYQVLWSIQIEMLVDVQSWRWCNALHQDFYLGRIFYLN